MREGHTDSGGLLRLLWQQAGIVLALAAAVMLWPAETEGQTTVPPLESVEVRASKSFPGYEEEITVTASGTFTNWTGGTTGERNSLKNNTTYEWQVCTDGENCDSPTVTAIGTGDRTFANGGFSFSTTGVTSGEVRQSRYYRAVAYVKSHAGTHGDEDADYTVRSDWKAVTWQERPPILDGPDGSLVDRLNALPGGSLTAVFLAPLIFAATIMGGTKSPVATVGALGIGMGVMIVITGANPLLWVIVVMTMLGGGAVALTVGRI